MTSKASSRQEFDDIKILIEGQTRQQADKEKAMKVNVLQYLKFPG